MLSLRGAAVLIFCCVLHITAVAGFPSATKFTKEPPSKIFAVEGSDVTFHWELSFRDFKDWNLLDHIIWGQTDGNDHIRNKYITVNKQSAVFNPILDTSIKSRTSWIGNVTRHRCKLMFVLRNVSKADQITYGCTVMVGGLDSRSGPINLFVHDPIPPKFTRRSNANVNADEEDDLRLHCNASGDPRPSITWSKDGTPLQNSSSSAVLQIPNLQQRDAGNYTCTAKNRAGSVSHSMVVRVVRYKPRINKTASSKPLFQSWIGKVTTLRCSADAEPLANFTWFKDGQRIVHGVNSGHNMGTLTLRPKTAGDFGSYSCRATNIKGAAWYHMRIFQIYAPSPPIIYQVTPDVLKFDITWNMTKVKNSSRTIEFMITLLDANRHVLQTHSGIKGTFFTLKNLQQNRTYILMLQARNIAGYGQAANVTVKTLEADPPKPPKVVVVPNVLSLNVTWFSSIEDNSIKIYDYLVKVVDYVSNTLVQEYKKVKETSLVINKLMKNRTYFVAIQARNEVGYGKPSNVSATTLLAGPPDAPLVTNISVSGKQCSLQWREPYNGQSAILKYTVYVWGFVARLESYTKERLGLWNTTNLSYTLELDWDKMYWMAVSAWNKYGESFPLLRRKFRTEKNPKAQISTKMPTVPTSSFTLLSSKKQESTVTKRKTEKLPTELPTARQAETSENRTGIFSFYAPIWFVALAFVTPIFMFVVWKITRRIIVKHCSKSSGDSDKQTEIESDVDSELGNPSYLASMVELKETSVLNEYESITDIFQKNLNLGYSMEDEKPRYSRNPVTHDYCYVSEGSSVYSHLNDIPTGRGSKSLKSSKRSFPDDKLGQDNGHLTTGLGMFDMQMYSHLTHGEPPTIGVKRGILPETSFLLPPSQKWEISRDRLRIENTVGRGEFGLVKKGYALDVTEEGGWAIVAVKTVKENSNGSQREDLLSELKVMKELFSHKHVVQLLACVTKSEPLCVITEYAPYGDLLGFLRKKRGLRDDYYDIQQLPERSLTSQLLMKFAWEIADGMAHLSAAKIIHRDLAARNVLLGENLTCKVTDFGMARNTRSKDIYERTSEGRLPLKWTALESLEHGRYTTKSDVWSFGVVLYEIFTIGGAPYPGVNVSELTRKLKSGYRMEKPNHVHNKLYDLMRSCWNKDPDKRLTFSQLNKTLNQLDREIQKCINLRAYNGKLYEDFQVFKK